MSVRLVTKKLIIILLLSSINLKDNGDDADNDDEDDDPDYDDDADYDDG